MFVSVCEIIYKTRQTKTILAYVIPTSFCIGQRLFDMPTNERENKRSTTPIAQTAPDKFAVIFTLYFGVQFSNYTKLFI